LDLYKTNLKQDYLRYEKKSEIWIDEVTKKLREKILWADELIFVFPIWWWDFPAIMKNFWDCNFWGGFWFKYEENWKKVSLLNWKTARVIATSWAPSFVYKIILHIQLLWNIGRIGFVWIKLKSFTIFGNMDRTATDRNKYLEKIHKLV
jgi:NAD(P)H dehydrogenase (quinone)